MSDAGHDETRAAHEHHGAGVEQVGGCPVCGDAERRALYADLVDDVCGVAPGKWRLWECLHCHSAYLDPRPTPETIGQAYASYYTHSAPRPRDDFAQLGFLRRLRRRLANGYLNWRFGTSHLPAARLGVLAAALPGMRTGMDRSYRHLPRGSSAGGCVLDVGCGSGQFLRLARDCGWKVLGLDFDPRVAAACPDLDVHIGTLDTLGGEAASFDVITLNHVIEHMHEPAAVLEECCRLLRPGGQLWLETPNIAGYGHQRFGRHWRGLEAPRHLVLFNSDSLVAAVKRAGFGEIRRRSRPSPTADMYTQSEQLRLGCEISAGYRSSATTRRTALLDSLRARLVPGRSEFTTISAIKRSG